MMNHQTIIPGRVAERFYQQPRWIVLTVLLACASGISSLLVLPRLEDPTLRSRAATIITRYPGADAERVESLVTEKIEDRLLDVAGIKRIRSQSRTGISFISIELQDQVTEPEPLWSEIRGKMEESISDLPAGIPRPFFDQLDVAAYAWIGSITWKSDSPVLDGILRRVARDLKDELIAIEGTKNVDIFGDPREEILVEVDNNAAAAAGLSVAEVLSQLRSSDIKTSAGMLHDDATEMVVEVQNDFQSLEDILEANLRTNQDGTSLKIKEIASVKRTVPDPVAARSIVDGHYGVVVAAMLRPDFRVDQWTVNSRMTIERFRDSLPPSIELDVIMEQESYVSSRMSSLVSNLAIGVTAVALVTLILMGWRSSLLVTATLPVASLMVLAGMRWLNIPIHQMSVTGLIIAMGLLIDNAIIAADEISLSLRRTGDALMAVRDMVNRLFAPLLASTVTTALSFAPIALMEGPAGEFVGSIAITVMLAIFSSLALSLTVLPVCAAYLQRGQVNNTTRDHGFWRQMWERGLTWDWLTNNYTRFLKATLRRPALGILIGVLLPVAGFLGASSLSSQFFPPTDRDQFYIEVELQPGSTIAHTENTVREIDQQLRHHPEVSQTAWFLGESAPAFYYNIVSRRKGEPNYAQSIVRISAAADARSLMATLQTELDRCFPTARILVRQLEQGPPFDAPIEVRLTGSDLAQLASYGEQIRAVMAGIPNVVHCKSTINEFQPVATVRIDPASAALAGLEESDVANQLHVNYEGMIAGSVVEEVEQIPVRVRLATALREDVTDLVSSTLLNPKTNGDTTTFVEHVSSLQSIAKVQLQPQHASITRYNGRRVNNVLGYVTVGTLPSKAVSDFEKAFASSGIQLPSGYRMDFGGEAAERSAALTRLLANVSVLAVGMLASLVLALNSFRLTALIGLVATLAIGLGLGGLFLFDYPFGFMAIIGTMGLVGVAINDSIVVVAAIRENPAARAGDINAITDTTVHVSRHVIATTATTIVGFLPLLMGGGGFWPPLAVAITVGVGGATLIALSLVPCAMRLLRDRTCPLASNTI